MGLKEDYQEKLEAQLSEWSSRINDFKAKADQMAADARVKYQEEMEALKAKYENAQRRLKDLKESGEGVWEELKGGLERAWSDLKESVERATARFGSEEIRREAKNVEREEEIRRIAQAIWEEEDRPDGRALEHWLRAEAMWEEQYRSKRSGGPSETAAQPGSRRKKTIRPKGRGRKPKAK